MRDLPDPHPLFGTPPLCVKAIAYLVGARMRLFSFRALVRVAYN